jgi:adenine-specific DNA-methyltransferase
VDSKYDASSHGTKLIKSMFKGEKVFTYPKSIHAVKDIIHLFTDSDTNDIVLDFFAGSGTTGHAVLALNKEDEGNRTFVLVEQMDYVEKVTSKRIQKVIQNEGIDNNFIYCELKEMNEEFIQKIKKASDTTEPLKIWKDMKEHAFLSYNIDPNDVDENAEGFKDLSLEDQKKFLIECLDKNNLYVNYSEIEDKQYNLGEEDIELNNKFYGKL